MDHTSNPPPPGAPASDIEHRVSITATLAEMESGLHIFVMLHLVCHFPCTLSLDWLSPTGHGKQFLGFGPPAAHCLSLQAVVAPEEILSITVSPPPAPPDSDIEFSDSCYFQILPGGTHTHELVSRAIDNDNWHTQFDLSITYLPTIYRPQLAFDPHHHPWPTE